MKNFIQNGDTVTLAAPYDVLSGAGLLVGSVFGVASGDTLSGVDIEAAVCGVYQLNKKTADAPSQGAKAYWDNTSKEITVTSTANTLVGVFLKAQINGDLICDVRLNGSF